MSVLAHEAWSLDSQHLKWFWKDDFFGAVLKDEWNIRGVPGSVAVIDQETGAIARITTGAADNNEKMLDWGDHRTLRVAKKVRMEVRAKLSTIDSIKFNWLLHFDLNDQLGFKFDADLAETNFMIYTEAGGVSTRLDSGIAADALYHIFRIVCHTHGGNHAHFFIDDLITEVANSPISTNVTAVYLQPFFYLATREAVAKSADLDYVGVEQLI